MKYCVLFFISLISSTCQAFEVSSSDLKNGGALSNGQVYQGFGCSGDNTSPELTWKNPPAGTKSFAVTMYDPDAPTGSGWWHWTVFNIPSTTTSLSANAGAPNSNSLPEGAIQGRTDFGNSAFGGACPPAGSKPHRYQIKVWALKTDKLPLDANASGALVGFMLNANSLGVASITAKYSRK